MLLPLGHELMKIQKALTQLFLYCHKTNKKSIKLGSQSPSASGERATGKEGKKIYHETINKTVPVDNAECRRRIHSKYLAQM